MDDRTFPRRVAPPDPGSRPTGLPPAKPTLPPGSPDWPCRTEPSEHLPARLVAFLYQLVRDGAPAPADVEQMALSVGSYQADSTIQFTNLHLELYARSLATFLTQPDGVE